VETIVQSVFTTYIVNLDSASTRTVDADDEVEDEAETQDTD